MLQNPSVCRGGTPCTPASFDEALYCTVHHSSIDAPAIAAALGIKYAYLSAASDPNRHDTHFQSRWLAPLMEATRNLAPLRFLAAASGCALVTLPTGLGSGDAVYARVADVVRELGEDVAAIQDVLADERVTAEELARVRREIHDTIEALLNLAAAMDQKAKDLAHPVVPAVAGTGKPAAARMALPAPSPARKAVRA